MTIKLKKLDLTFYEIPKTGSSFVREALNKLGIEWKILKPFSHFNLVTEEEKLKRNSALNLTKNHELSIKHLPWYATEYSRFSVCNVRHPITWYESYWKYFHYLGQMKSESQFMPLFYLGESSLEGNFSEFIDRIINEHPALYTRIIETFFGSPLLNKITHIIKLENINEDLYNILLHYKFNLSCDISIIKNMNKVNYSRKEEKTEWTKEQKEKILYLEKEVIRRFKYNEEI